METLDNLIKAGDNAAALQEIARLSLERPEAWNSVAPRLETVLQSEQRFVSAVSQVLATLDENATAQDVVAAMQRLESLNPNRPTGSETRYTELVSTVRELVEYRVAKDEHDRFEKLAEEHAAAGRYVQAIQASLEGARELVAMSADPTGELARSISVTQLLVASSTETITRGEQVLAAAPDTSSDVLAVMDELINLRAQAYRLREVTTPGAPTPSASTGYSSALALSVITTLDEMYSAIATRTCEEVLRQAEPELEAITAIFDADGSSIPAARIESLYELYMTGLRAAAYLAAVPASSSAHKPASTVLPLLMMFQERAVETAAYRQLAGMRDTARKASRTDQTALADVVKALDSVLQAIAEAKELANQIPARVAVLEHVADLGYSIAPLVASVHALDRRVQATLPLLAAAEDALSATAIVQAQREVDALAREATTLGTSVREVADARGAPDAQRLERLGRDARSLVSRLRDYQSTWNALASSLTRRRDLARHISKAAETEKLVSGYVTQIAQLQSQRQVLVAGGATSREDGLKRVEDARTNLRIGRPEQALQDVIAAQSLLDRALSVNPDAQVLALRDGELIRLYEQAVRGSVTNTVRTIRQAIDRGRAAFAIRDTATSTAQFSTAGQLWERFTTLGNQEIAAWTGLAMGAKDIQDRLVIPTTHARYKEVQDLYAEALTLYRKGEQELKQSKTRDALSSFRDADTALTKIRRIMPYHRDARALSLRIVQISDQQRFSFRLSTEIRSAEAKMASSPEESYFDFKVLEDIAPDNETVRRRVTELETKLGLLIPQPSQKNREDAEKLRAQAAAAASLTEAYNLLDKAVYSNLTSAELTAAKDKHLTDTDLLVGTILTHADQMAYQEAVEIKASDRKKATQIVDDLLKAGRNWRYAPLPALQRELRR